LDPSTYATSAAPTYAGSANEIGLRTMRTVTRRIIPFLVLMFCVNFLDRVNIGFAALSMNVQLGFAPEVYGLAGGIFFLTYTFFEIPSNLILQRLGARRWLSIIMIAWGICASLMAFVYNAQSLYLFRCLLGIAEAGFFPGLILYLMAWFPKQDRARALALIMLGSPISVIIGGPLSTSLMSMQGFLGFDGWRWMFLLEGIPAVVVGIIASRRLINGPADANWLEPEQRTWLANRLAQEVAAKVRASQSRWASMASTHVWSLAAVKFCILLAFYGFSLWLPQIIKQMGGLTTLQIGIVTALPYAVSGFVSVVIGRHSDRTGERVFHIAIPALCGAAGFVLATVGNPILALCGLCIAAAGLWTANALFWVLPAAFLAGAPAAVGIALINMFGNIGSFCGPYVTGWLKMRTGSYTWPLLVFALSLVIAAVIVMILNITDDASKVKGVDQKAAS
jgi:MFS transporter, ACS family, tartrate transporter